MACCTYRWAVNSGAEGKAGMTTLSTTWLADHSRSRYPDHRQVIHGGRTAYMMCSALAATAALDAGLTVAFPSLLRGAAVSNGNLRVRLSRCRPSACRCCGSRTVLGAGLYLAVLAVFAIAIGALVRHTAAITGVVGFVLVLSPLTQLLPGSLGKHIHAYLPSEAGSLIASPRQGVNDLLAPWQGFGIFCLETAVLIVAAAYLLRRRDA